MKKIYFAGSIRGGRVDADLYRRMIEYMQKTDTVLTEHVGSPHLNLMEQGKRDVEIYDQDMSWPMQRDSGSRAIYSMTGARPSSPPCSPATRISTFTHIHQRRKSFLHLMKY